MKLPPVAPVRVKVPAVLIVLAALPTRLRPWLAPAVMVEVLLPLKVRALAVKVLPL